MRSRPTKSYWRAYEALYAPQCGSGNPLVPKVPPKRSIAPKDDAKYEDEEQIIAATWLTQNGILFYHVPNGERRDAHVGAKLKHMGVKAGVPDICIPLPRKSYHGLYIELKRVSGGTLSQAQKFWLAELKREGYDCYVAHGADDLINYVKKYLGS